MLRVYKACIMKKEIFFTSGENEYQTITRITEVGLSLQEKNRIRMVNLKRKRNVNA